MAQLSLHLLGTFQAALDEQPVTGFESNKARALLAYLAVESNRPHSRETLACLLWPNQSDQAALHNLRQVLSNLRQALQDHHAAPPFLCATRQTLQFNVTSPHRLDVSLFTGLLDACAAHAACHQNLTPCEPCLQRLAQAESLYRGEFLAGFFVADSVTFEEWLLMQRERYHRLALQLLGQLADHYAQSRDYARASHYARRRVTLDPWQEENCQQLMRLLAHSGQANAALAHYETCRKTLAADLGVEPMPETTALYERIRAARTTRRRHLPTYPTPFIGRAQELTEISHRLANPACRLLTLVGPGGMGKTRLAVQAATECSHEFLQGVCFAPLTTVTSAEHLVLTLADALDISLTGSRAPKTQLFDYLRNKEILLVLDNFEHLLAAPLTETKNDGAGLVVELLQAAPEVKLCITSREHLSLQEEWLFDVTGLTFPSSDTLPAGESLAGQSAEALKTYSAVQLFVQAQQRLQPNFAPTATDYYFIGCLCGLLQGVPLGLELAAGWGRLLSCREIFSQTQSNLDFLTSQARNAADRHQSFRAVFDHSWRLLLADEQAALRQLSVFRGAFGGEAAQAVANAAPATLLALVNKSCLSYHHQAGQYTLHALLKQYLAEKLAACPLENEATPARHSDYYAGWLQQRQNALKSSRQAGTLTEIRAEFDDARAAWQWAAAHQNSELLSRMVEGIYLFCGARGHYQEGQELLAQAAQSILAMAAPNRPLLAQIWTRQADFCGSLSDDDQAQSLLQQSLEVWQAAPVQIEFAFTLLVGGRLAYWFGRYDEAQTHLQASIALYRQTGDPWGLAQALNDLGNVICGLENNYDLAIPLYEESLTLSRQTGDLAGIARALINLGAIAQARREFARAKPLYQESVVISRQIGHRRNLAISLTNLGETAGQCGEYDEAEKFLLESLDIKRETGNRQSVVYSLQGLGRVAGGQGRYPQAKRWYAEALQITREIGATVLTASILMGVVRLLADQGHLERAVELLIVARRHAGSDQELAAEVSQFLIELETRLTPQARAACYQRGEVISLERAVAEVSASD